MWRRELQRRDTYPTRHETKTTKSTTDTQGTLATELDGDKTEWLITGRNQCEVGATEKIRGKGGEFRLGVHTIWIEFHQACQFLRREAAVKINDGADTDELNLRALFEPMNEVCQQCKTQGTSLTLTEKA